MPRNPDVSSAVCSPSSLHRRSTLVTNGRWIKGSPPESVTPPCMILSAAARRAMRSISLSRVVSRPSDSRQVSGLWQY